MTLNLTHHWSYWHPRAWRCGRSLGLYEFGPIGWNPVYRHTANGIRWVFRVGNVFLTRYQPCTCD